jgi:hypothetical protein
MDDQDTRGGVREKKHLFREIDSNVQSTFSVTVKTLMVVHFAS